MKQSNFVAAAGIAALSCLLAGAPARADEMVVVVARGVALHPGERIDTAKPLVLAEGQHVTLVALNGTTLKLDGPYDKPPAAAGSGGSAAGVALDALMTQAAARTNEAGVTRAGAPRARLPDPWVLDVSRSGTVCLVAGQKPVLWRPSASRAAKLSVMPADRSWKAEATWPEGADRLVLASDITVNDGTVLFVTLDDGEEAAVTVTPVPADLPTTEMRVAWLADQGCEPQAEALLRQRP